MKTIKLTAVHKRVLHELDESGKPFSSTDAIVRGACEELAAAGILTKRQSSKPKGFGFEIKTRFQRRNPLKDPQAGDVFRLKPLWPDGRKKTESVITITKVIPSEDRERFVHNIKRGSSYLTYTTASTPGNVYHLEVGGMVNKLKREHAEVVR